MVAMLGAPATGVAAEGPGVVSAGNGIYTIFVHAADQPAAGTITLATGPRNPFGRGLSLLFGGDRGPAGTTFASVRLYHQGAVPPADYTEGVHDSGASFEVGSFDDRGVTTVARLGPAGVRITHTVEGSDAFALTESVDVLGTTFENSAVAIKLTLTNQSTAPADFGLRSLLDLAVAGDDGPTLRLDGAGGPVTTAGDLSSPPTDRYVYADNDTDPAPLPVFAVSGDAVPPPARLQFACRPEATRFPFAYEIHAPVDVASPSKQCSPTGGGDSALLSYWGADATRPIALAPGASFTATQTLRIVPVRPIPTVLTADPAVVTLRPLGVTVARLRARLTTTAGVPVVGRTVTFADRLGEVCGAETDGHGDAACTGLRPWGSAVLALGYTVSFAGDGTYAPARTAAPLVG